MKIISKKKITTMNWLEKHIQERNRLVKKTLRVKIDIYFKCLKTVDTCWTMDQLASAKKLVGLFEKQYSIYDLEGVFRLRDAIERRREFLVSPAGVEPASEGS